MRTMGKFLIALSGANPEVLARCPTERIKFQSLGWAIMITCAMATVSMWFALTSVMGFNPVLAFPVAVLWGLIIMGIDRWLVTSLPIDGSRKWTIAVPRLLLAVLLGSLISTPIVLRIFQSEINNEIAVIKAERAASFLTSQQHSSVVGQVTKWTNTVNNLDEVIQTQGSEPINPTNDPVVQGLTTQRNAELTLEQKYYTEWRCQLYGGSSCASPKGNGPLAQTSEANYLQAQQQAANLLTQIQAREKELQASDASSQQARLQQAQSQLPAAQAQLKAATLRENQLQGNFDTTNEATNGLLIRLEALNDLSGSNFTLNMARLLLFLLFLVIECLPVTVKLLQRPGNYEKILLAAARRELDAARRAVRGNRIFQQEDLESEFGTATAHSGGARDLIDDEIEKVWQPHESATILKPMPPWRSTERTEELARHEEESSEPNPYEEALHTRVTDTRDEEAFSDTGPRTGYQRRPSAGIEKHYHSDDL